MQTSYEDKIRTYIAEHHIQAEHLTFDQSCHSVAEAAEAVHAAAEDFIKSICFIDSDRGLIVAVIKGEDRASPTAVAAALNIRKPRLATPDEILERTGYPCGGTPPFGFPAIFLIDPRVMERAEVYGGGGSETLLIRITPKEIQRANQGQIKIIRI